MSIIIKKAAFQKGDFQYSIDYLEGADNKKLETNEEALSSMDFAKEHIESAIKRWLQFPESFAVRCNSVKFGGDETKPSTIQMTVYTKEKGMNVVTSIRSIMKGENFPDKDHVNCIDAINELRGEILRYVRGERAQGELAFDAVEETTESDGFDLFDEGVTDVE